jgi:RHS repeat-associated protein
MDASNFITHKSPRLSVLERIAWLAGKTCGRLGMYTQGPGQFTIESGTTTYSVVALAAASLNVWHHLVGMRDGDSIKFYIDGVLQGSTFVGNIAVNNVGRDLLVACLPAGTTGSTKISADDLAIYHRALSDEEVMQLYNAACNDAELVVTSACTVTVPDAFAEGEEVYVTIDGVQHLVATYIGQGNTVEECLHNVATGLTTLGLTCTNANGVVSVPEWPSNWEWDTPADIAALDCGGGDVAYRFGFQGQEKDDEIYGATGTSYAFEYRMHDPRVGRFLSVDPLAAKYAYNSPYAFAENKVIQFIELEGLEIAESAANSGSTNTVEPPTLTGALMGGSDINQNTLLPPVTITPPSKLGPLPTADNTDHLGYFKAPSAAEREAHPVGSLLKDISLPIINNLSLIGLVDNLSGMATDDDYSAGQVTTATLDAMFSGVGMRGRGTSWSSARRWHWKDRASNAIDGEFSPNNMLRMRKGNAPQHDALGVSMELHHVEPVRNGGSHDYQNLIEVWPWEHAAIDPYRFYNGPTP